MIGALILIIVLYFITQPILNGFKARSPWLNLALMQNLFWYHMFFAGVYYVFALYAPSDSVAYYQRPQEDYETWFSAYKTGTPFIDFLGYPFINYLGFSYEMMMTLFAWLGYWGFVYFYIFFKENLTFKHTFQGYDLVTLFIFLPNMHYWTSSLGKGSTIFLGLAMAIYGLSKIDKRKLALIMGLLIVYHVRPHVFMFMAIGIVVGLFTGKQNVPFYQKFLVFAGSAAALVFMYDDIMAFTGLDGDNLLESFDQFSTTRSGELAKANSGIDISNYPLILKLLTFWFRPLFFDAPGPVGIIVSFENLLYVYLAAKLFQKGFFKFLRKSSAMVKTGAVVFLATSFALSGTLSNLGIIIRQKSMVMYFFLFLILSFMDYKKGLAVIRKKKLLEQQKRIQNLTIINEA
jgi:hypothetical protein